MKFIGRHSELETLQREFERDDGFIVIYGRRRVGKTTLIKEFIKDKKAMYFLATEEVESQGLSRFTDVLSKFTEQPHLKNAKFSKWYDLFEIVANYKPNEKKVIIIDEFPYLVKVNPAFPSILQNIWDEKLKNNNIMMILCGSLISMMKKYALAYESPLYGRRTAQIRLMPLRFTEINEVSKDSFTDTVEKFAITGGVPKYLEFFDDKRNLHEKIEETILSKNGFLYEEPSFLLKEEVREPVNYYSIIKTIAAGNHKIGNIGSVLQLESAKLMPYLSTLIELGFVEKLLPITEKNPEKSRKGLYFISDNFMRFWFKYVYPFKGELELDNMGIVFEQMEKDFNSKFIAFTYEDICRDIFANLCEEKKILFSPSKIGSYWLNDYERKDTQIDVLAIDNKNKLIFAGECKYHAKPVDADVYFDLMKKIENAVEIKKVFKGYKIQYGVFSKSGFSKRLLDIAKGNSSLYLINEDKIAD